MSTISCFMVAVDWSAPSNSNEIIRIWGVFYFPTSDRIKQLRLPLLDKSIEAVRRVFLEMRRGPMGIESRLIVILLVDQIAPRVFARPLNYVQDASRFAPGFF